MGSHPPPDPEASPRDETKVIDRPVPAPSSDPTEEQASAGRLVEPGAARDPGATGVASGCRLVTQGYDAAGLAILAVECPNHPAPVPVDHCLDCSAFRHLGATLGKAAQVVCTPETVAKKR